MSSRRYPTGGLSIHMTIYLQRQSWFIYQSIFLCYSYEATPKHFNSEFRPKVNSWAALQQQKAFTSVTYNGVCTMLLCSRCNVTMVYCYTISWSLIYLHATRCSGYRWVSGWQHISYDLAFVGIIILCYF